MKRIHLVAGARPNFMKIAPLWRALHRSAEHFDTAIVHTGQHYDDEMSDVFSVSSRCRVRITRWAPAAGRMRSRPRPC